MKTIVAVALAVTCAMSASLHAASNLPPETKPPEGSAASLPGSERFGTDPLSLLQIKKVQKELKLTPDQIDQIAKLAADVNAGAEKSAKDVKQKDVNPKNFEKFLTQSREKVGAILKKDQLERFKEILLQVQGPAALGDKEIAEKLKVTPEQEEKLRGIATAANEKARGAFERPRSSDPKEVRKVMDQNAAKLEDLFADSNKDMASALTAQQKEQLEKMRGAEFKLEKSDFAGQ